MKKPMLSIKLVEPEEFNDRQVEMIWRMGSGHISEYIEAFRSFLLMAGFVDKSIEKYLGEDDRGS